MNDKKICFITCVNNHELYSEALYYINQLEIPQGYEIECISVENAKSMTHGYNKAMQSSDAKYKVYLHQDTYIRNISFVKDVINVFVNDDKIGMIGVIGAKIIPTNGIWWEAKEKFGKVYDSNTGQMALLNFNEVSSAYETVHAIDGLIMVTQYDIPWREDIFDGWHFYDVSQSIEFIKLGYEVAIPRQDEPWIIHDCGIVNVRNGYEYYRRIFLKEYSKDIFPLVSILIPTHNRPEFFRLALESAINQTYDNIEIIICDDSDNDLTEKLVSQYLDKYKFINYYRTSKDYNFLQNTQECLKYAKGEYINYLMDDDLFAENKIEKMTKCFLENKDISIVTSYRKLIDNYGNILPDISSTKCAFANDTILNGTELAKYLLTKSHNIIGEPTTAMFRKAYIENYGIFFNKTAEFCADVATWLTLLLKGNCAYMTEPLSFFRMHNNQETYNMNIFAGGILDWFYFIKAAYENQVILNKLDFINALTSWMNTQMTSINIYNENKKFIKDSHKIKKFDEEFRKAFTYIGDKIKETL